MSAYPIFDSLRTSGLGGGTKKTATDEIEDMLE